MSIPVLQLDGFSVAYRTVEAVHSVQLHVNEGEIVTVIGPNGAGKTTLLCAAMGLLPSTGSLALHGERIVRPGVETMVARGVALVPERRELFGDMSVEDNLLLGGFYQWRKGTRDQRARMDEVFEIFPRLRERRPQRASTLSGGERQMLAIGRAMSPRSAWRRWWCARCCAWCRNCAATASPCCWWSRTRAPHCRWQTVPTCSRWAPWRSRAMRAT